METIKKSLIFSECGDKGGSVKGGCAAGFGVCCVFMYNDDDQTDVNYNDTYLQNPDYPSVYSDTNNIDYTINKVDQGKNASLVIAPVVLV